MSIWATFFSIEDGRDHLPAEMLDAPLVYQGSHVLPADSDERGGYLILSGVPGHVCHDGREHEQPIEEEYWPYLRVEVAGKGNTDKPIILTRQQAERLHSTLGEWLLSTVFPDELLEC